MARFAMSQLNKGGKGIGGEIEMNINRNKYLAGAAMPVMHVTTCIDPLNGRERRGGSGYARTVSLLYLSI